MTEFVFIDKQYRWSSLYIGDNKFYYIGRSKSNKIIIDFISDNQNTDITLLKKNLCNIPGHYAMIIDSSDKVIAITDKIRSYPIFFYKYQHRIFVSNSARFLQEKFSIKEVNKLSQIEMHMAGYVTGDQTIFENLYQMQTSGILIWNKQRKEPPQIDRYYLFYSENVKSQKDADLIEELDDITNNIFSRIIEDAGDQEIIVPLSGGLDSRLILCKLKEFGYKNVKCFSYGAPQNNDALTARYVAEKVGYPWKFFPTTYREAQNVFKSEERRAYWRFADGLFITPNLHAFFALRKMKQTKFISDKAIVINGQSGDFIAGAHIPDLSEKEISIEGLCSRIIQKHYSLKRTYLKDRSKIELISKKILDVFPVAPEFITNQEFAKFYELWEWQERQAKRVINGQRNYDFIGLKWELPLWEEEYLKFWMEIPLNYKVKRSLFRKYVERKNFFYLFKDFKSNNSRYPGIGLNFFQYLAGGTIKRMFGENASQYFHRRLEYFSQYSYLYAHVGFGGFQKKCIDYKSAISYFTDSWLKENLY